MRRINRTTGTTFVFSTHDPKVLNMANRRVDLEDGMIVRLGMRVQRDWTFTTKREAHPSAPEPGVDVKPPEPGVDVKPPGVVAGA